MISCRNMSSLCFAMQRCVFISNIYSCNHNIILRLFVRPSCLFIPCRPPDSSCGSSDLWWGSQRVHGDLLETSTGQWRCWRLQLHHWEKRHQQRPLDHSNISFHQDHMQGGSRWWFVDQTPVTCSVILKVFKALKMWTRPQIGAGLNGSGLSSPGSTGGSLVKNRNVYMLLFYSQIPKLTEGREYIMRICAENMYGISDPLDSEEMRAKDLFSKFFANKNKKL